MHTLPANSRAPTPRISLLLAALGLALAVPLVYPHLKAKKVAEADRVEPPSVARSGLQNRDGIFYRGDSSTAFTGWLTDHAPDGSVRLRTAVVDGRLHGVSEGWTTNRTLELREYFQHGLPHGPRITWHPNGQKRSAGQMALGRQQGSYHQWTDAGALAAEAEFKDGKPHGISRAWHPSGCLKAEALMNNGEVVTRHFYPDGAQREPTLLAGAPPNRPATPTP